MSMVNARTLIHVFSSKQTVFDLKFHRVVQKIVPSLLF